MNLRRFTLISLLITAILIFAEILLLAHTNALNNKIVIKALDEFTNSQKLAISNFLKSVDTAFQTYINNIPMVVKDKPKWRIIWNTITLDKQEAQTIITKHFENIFEDKNNTLNSAIDTLNYEQQKAYNNLFEKFDFEIKNKNIKQSHQILKESLSNVLNSIESTSNKATLLSTISAIATEELTRIGITATFSTITTSTTAGATGGSVLPVVGTTIGIVVGLASGITAEYFIEKSLNQELSDQITKALTDSQSKIKQTYKTIFLNNLSKQRAIIKAQILNSN